MSIISQKKKKGGVKGTNSRILHSVVRLQNPKLDKIQGRLPRASPKLWSFKGGIFLCVLVGHDVGVCSEDG